MFMDIASYQLLVRRTEIPRMLILLVRKIAIAGSRKAPLIGSTDIHQHQEFLLLVAASSKSANCLLVESHTVPNDLDDL